MAEKILKYSVIKTKAQYKAYTKVLQELDEMETTNDEQEKEIELLALLIEKWDEEHNSFYDVDPITLLKSLMEERGIRPIDVTQPGLSKSLLSEILNYKKSMSKEVIRMLAEFFKLSQESLNRPYQLKISRNKTSRSRQKKKKIHAHKKSSSRRLQTA
jgi:HTH-type transcriptional regulator / antitoxin HigA